jgi:hypothetical protein
MDKQKAKLVYEKNLDITAKGLLGFDAPSVLAPTKENIEKFNRQFETHFLCGCVGCVELGKMFIKADHELNERVIGVSTQELDAMGR